MPARNVVKQYEPDTMYHVYNRGNNKRQIFFDQQDFTVFLSFFKFALLSDESYKAKDTVDKSLISEAAQFNIRRLRLSGKLELVSFCLLPNHFHLQLYQHEADAISKLMRSVMTGYVMYFNKRYKTSGGLFQGVYKAKKVSDDSYWQHISRYIHLNAIDVGSDFRYYNNSSYKYYSGAVKSDWVSPEKGKCGMTRAEYEKFINDWVPHRQEVKSISGFLADK